MNPFSLDPAFDLETPTSENRHQPLFPSTPVATNLSDISSFIISSIREEEEEDEEYNPCDVIRKNLDTILSFLPLIPSQFTHRLVCKGWESSIKNMREKIRDGKISIPLLTFSKHKHIIFGSTSYIEQDNLSQTSGVNTPQNYQKSSMTQSSLINDFPLTMLKHLCDNQSIIGQHTRIETLELLGLTIPEMEYILKRLVQLRNSQTSSNKLILPPTPSGGMMMDNLDAFPPTPAVFKSSLTETFRNSYPFIKNLVICWPNTTSENNFAIPSISGNQSGIMINSQVFSLSALDTSESQIQQPPNDDDDDSDMDEFIEYNDENQDYTTVEPEDGSEDEDSEDAPLKTIVSFNPQTISVLQTIETILIVDATNERNLINYDILVDKFNAESSSSVDDVEFQTSDFSMEDPKKYNHLLDFIFFNKTIGYVCKMKFLRNPFFYYAEDNYHDMVNSELKPYLNGLEECKYCGPLFHYSRLLLSNVISSEYKVDMKFLRESWSVILKPLYQFNLLNWNDVIYKEGSEKADVVQVAFRSVFDHYVRTNSISSELFRKDLASNFSTTYNELFLQSDNVSVLKDILETLSEWKRNSLSQNEDLKSYNPSLSHCWTIKNSLQYALGIDQLFASVLSNISDKQNTVIGWSDLLQSGEKRTISHLSTETKKKRIQLSNH